MGERPSGLFPEKTSAAGESRPIPPEVRDEPNSRKNSWECATLPLRTIRHVVIRTRLRTGFIDELFGAQVTTWYCPCKLNPGQVDRKVLTNQTTQPPGTGAPLKAAISVSATPLRHIFPARLSFLYGNYGY